MRTATENHERPQTVERPGVATVTRRCAGAASGEEAGRRTVRSVQQRFQVRWLVEKSVEYTDASAVTPLGAVTRSWVSTTT